MELIQIKIKLKLKLIKVLSLIFMNYIYLSLSLNRRAKRHFSATRSYFMQPRDLNILARKRKA